MFWAMEDMVTTRPIREGVAIGLLSGVQAAVIYSFYCVEMALLSWAVWYVHEIPFPAVPGILLGRRVSVW
ncbi:hypothetical protein AX768_30675 (plasmid) [Burkholderia sp. PAMC 28687]|nr:hypothetical protein AXG89_32485 [Burkholderia sp. PAMC 26561]AMM18592.1 hypothetical protein AX768_30675 [Burkholderia sp. PAMC 28687]